MTDENCLPSRNAYRSLFESNISALELEIQRLKHETDSCVQNNQQYNSLSKTAEDLSQQTEDLRNELEDYNMARMNSFYDAADWRKEIDDLHAHNQQVESIIAELHLEKQRKEERILQLQNGDEENDVTILKTQLTNIRKQTSGSIIHQEALSLIDQIVELESKYTQLIEDEEDENLEHYFNEIQKIQQTNLILLVSISQMLTTANIPQLQALEDQHRKLKQEFRKLETLDRRLVEELRELKMKYNEMQEEIGKFNDLEGLKHRSERRKQRLTLEKVNRIQQRQITQMEIQNLQSQFESLQTQLRENQTHQQLIHLEQTLQTLFSQDELPIPYESIKHQALSLVHAHNQWLIDRLKSRS